MLENKNKPKLSKIELEKRRTYMRAYYQRKKLGKIKPKKHIADVKFSIKRGHFLVFFE